jgi:electron transport complex protein RnfB
LESCPAYFVSPDSTADKPENRVCPTGALQRRRLSDRRYEYTIRAELCVTCGRCVRACRRRCNASLAFQIRHDVCWNCTECTLGQNCPRGAVRRIPAKRGYLNLSGSAKA